MREQETSLGHGEQHDSAPDAPTGPLIAEGDRVVARWTMRGTHLGELRGGVPSAGKPCAVTGATTNRVAGGKLAEDRLHHDPMGLLLRLGLVEPPAAATSALNRPAEQPASLTTDAAACLVDAAAADTEQEDILYRIAYLLGAIDTATETLGRYLEAPGVRDAAFDAKCFSPNPFCGARPLVRSRWHG